MEYFKEIAFKNDTVKINLPNQEDMQVLLNHVNSIRPLIQSKMEKEMDHKLVFTDVLITQTKHEFKTSVHCKLTFLNFPSHNLYSVKKGLNYTYSNPDTY